MFSSIEILGNSTFSLRFLFKQTKKNFLTLTFYCFFLFFLIRSFHFLYRDREYFFKYWYLQMNELVYRKIDNFPEMHLQFLPIWLLLGKTFGKRDKETVTTKNCLVPLLEISSQSFFYFLIFVAQIEKLQSVVYFFLGDKAKHNLDIFRT